MRITLLALTIVTSFGFNFERAFAYSCSSWSTSSTADVIKLDDGGNEVPQFVNGPMLGGLNLMTVTAPGGVVIENTPANAVTGGNLQMRSPTSGSETSRNTSLTLPGQCSPAGDILLSGLAGPTNLTVFTTWKTYNAGFTSQATVCMTKTAPNSVTDPVQNVPILVNSPAIYPSGKLRARYTLSQAITDKFSTSQTTGRPMVFGFNKYYRACDQDSCTGLTFSESFLQRVVVSDNSPNPTYSEDTIFRTNYKSDYVDPTTPVEDRMEGHVITLAAGAGTRGYHTAGYRREPYIQPGTDPNHINGQVARTMLFVENVVDSGLFLGTEAAFGTHTPPYGQRLYVDIKPLIGALGDNEPFSVVTAHQIKPYGSAGQVVVYFSVTNPSGATAFDRLQRAYVLRTGFNASGLIRLDPTFGTGGVVRILNDFGTKDRLNPRDMAVTDSGKIVVTMSRSVFQDGMGIRAQRLLSNGQPDNAFASNGLKVIIPSGCSAIIDDLRVAVSGTYTYLGLNGRTY